MTENAREWTTFGRYVLLEKIGTGGMAEIFRAKTFGAAGFEKEFAIKLILPSLIDDTEFVNMFINEAKIAVSLYHANVVQVFDLGQIEGQYYIAMEFVHGKDLLDVLARCAELDIKIPLHLVLFITMEMLKGLDFAHRAKDAYGEDLNIIHRDVSPSNILMSYAGDVKVGDFGVAKAAIQRNLTESGTLKGKVGYMSPEQVMGERIDARSDIFAAGIVFFEALSMSRLFVGSSDLDVMLRVRDADIRDSLRKAEPIPSDLREIVERALSRHREERYQTAGEFYQALVDFCFRHNIKVTESNVSNFMRRLFAEEIEEEKARRRSDPHAPIATSLQTPSAPSVAASDTLEDADILEQLSDSLEHIAPQYRYRDADGLIYGPMSLESLEDLIRDKPPQPEDRVMIQGENEWLELFELSALSETFAERGITADDPEPEPPPVAEAAVFRAKPRRRKSRTSTNEHPPTSTSLPEETVEDSAGATLTAEGDEEEATATDEQGDDAVGIAETEAAEMMAPTAEMTSADPGDSEGDDKAEEVDAPIAGDEAHRSGSQLSMRDVEALREHYDAYNGTLKEISIARMLSRLHRIKSTGRLHLERGEVAKSIFFRNGEIIYVDSNKKEELLGAFLTSRDLITQEQLEQGLERLSEWGGRLGDALVATGAIPAHDIFTLLSEQMAEKLLDIFTWPGDASYGYFENQEPSAHGYPLDVDCYDIIVRGCRERVTMEYLSGFYKERMHVSMYMREPAPFHINKLKLRANELRISKQIEEGMSMHGLLRKFPPSQRNLIYRTVYLLHQSELLTFELTTQELEFPEY